MSDKSTEPYFNFVNASNGDEITNKTVFWGGNKGRKEIQGRIYLRSVRPVSYRPFKPVRKMQGNV